jgi:hypothetical protein
MAEPRKSKIAQTLERIKTTTKGGGTTEAALTLLNEFGLGNGDWCIDAKPQLERMEEWYELAPLYVRALAALKLHTLGYLPTSGGVDRKLNLDERRFGHCKKHGALLAITQVGKGRLIPFGMAQMRNELNEAAVRSFIAQWGREPSDEEKERVLFVTAGNLRDSVAYLEELGICFRADNEDTPLAELRETPEGKAKVKKLSGDNKIRIYVYLRPRPSKVAQGTTTDIPSRVISKELKPLYKVLFGLKLDIDPAAFAFDGDLQATIREELDAREALIRERDEVLRQAILLRYPSAQASAVLNPIDQQSDRQRPNLEQDGNDTTAGRRTAENPSPKGRQRAIQPPAPSSSPGGEQALAPPSPEIDLVSRPRGSQRVPSSESGRDLLSCDSQFASDVIAAFVEGNRPSPNLKQVAAVQKCLPDSDDARTVFVAQLREKMKRIAHPGVLSSMVEEFNLAWPAVEAQRKSAAFASAPREIRCKKCGDSGMVSGHFDTIKEAIEQIESGDTFCGCPEGQLTRDLVEPELLRKAVKVS